MGKANRKIINKGLNRYEKGGLHFYVREYPEARTGKSTYNGLIKCKLVHGLGYSIIIPDFIFVTDGNSLRWFQTIFFSPCLLGKYIDKTECRIFVDIAHGNKIEVVFCNVDLKAKYQDGSELFTCEIIGPPDLIEFSTGVAKRVESEIYVQLYHHTTEATVSAINKNKYFYPSQWNIQGNKRLTNVGYVYFSCLPEIKSPDDLFEIAMSHAGVIKFLVDDGVAQNPNDVLSLKVYRDSTANRTHTITKLVPISSIATKPILKHAPAGEAIFYEFVSQFIYRVGIEPSTVLKFDSQKILANDAEIKHFEYAVIGDARTLDGIAAPYDEENTSHILKVERTPASMTILDFWFAHSNQDHFTGKAVERLEFE